MRAYVYVYGTIRVFTLPGHYFERQRRSGAYASAGLNPESRFFAPRSYYEANSYDSQSERDKQKCAELYPIMPR